MVVNRQVVCTAWMLGQRGESYPRQGGVGRHELSSQAPVLGDPGCRDSCVVLELLTPAPSQNSAQFKTYEVFISISIQCFQITVDCR